MRKIKRKTMSAPQCTEKATNFSPTTTGSTVKTPFGIEDILYINNNSSNVNKNGLLNEKSAMKNSAKGSENEEFKKILTSER